MEINIDELNDLQRAEGLHLVNRLTKSHVQIKKTNYESQTCCTNYRSSVADFLEYLITIKQTNIEDSSATIEFIRVFVMLLDILNSRSIVVKYGKQTSIVPKRVRAQKIHFDKS